MLPLQARVDPEVMTVKVYSAFLKSPEILDPHHQIVQCQIPDIRCGSRTSLQRCNRCFLQLQPTETRYVLIKRIFTDGLNMPFPLRGWVENKVEIHWLSGKEKVPAAINNKECHRVSATEHERPHHYWFPWICCLSKQCFLFPSL